VGKIGHPISVRHNVSSGSFMAGYDVELAQWAFNAQAISAT
jgi:hypothetical protein